MATIFVRGIDPKLKAKWQKVLAKNHFTEALVIEKYLQMVAREGRVRTEEWL